MKNNKNKSIPALSVSESRLKAILETVVDGIITINCKGIIETVNPAVESIFGYPAEEMIGQNIKILMPSSYADEHDSYLDHYLTTGEKKIIGIGREVTGKRKDNSTFPMELAVSEMDVNGERMFTGIVRDITKRKQFETDAEDRKQRIKILIDTIADGLIVIDEKGCIETFNPAAQTIFGYQFHEVQSKNIKILMPRPYSDAHDSYIDNYLKSGNSKIMGVSREVIGKRKDGSTFPMDLTISEMWVHGKRLFNGIVRDVSERKAAELTESKKRALEITAAFERTQSKVMSLFSTNFNIDLILKSTLDLLDEAHDFPVSAVYLFDEWHGVLKCKANHGLPESFCHDQLPGNGLVGQAAQTGKTILLTSGEKMPFRIDTGLFTIEPETIVVSPIIYSDKVLGVLTLAKTQSIEEGEIVFVERLTHQIGVSLNNLNQYHNMKILSDQLKQRGQEISHKNLQLERANRLKTEFLANMSHELRTPLNAIIGFSEILKDQLQGELNEYQDDYVGEILSSANHLLSLINDILDLSKIEAGKVELYLEPLNLPELFHNSISVVKEQAYARNINLNLSIDEQLDEIIVADVRKLKQIIFNLLSNAVKFTENGGSVTIEASRINDNFLVKVTDTGIGIPADKINLLFLPFEQLDGSLSRLYSGTGLGLAMVKRLVELHGGEVGVISTEGEGSCFHFTIPYRGSSQKDFLSNTLEPAKYKLKQDKKDRAEQALSDIQAALSEDHSQNKNKKFKVLVIEDDEKQAELLRLYLQEAGYQVALAANGQEGIEQLKRSLPDLITLDLLMPEMDGFTFLDIKTKIADFAHIPVIVLSIVSEQMQESALVADAVLHKPIHRADLLLLIENLLPRQRKESSKPKLLLIDDDPKSIKIINSYLPQQHYEVMSAIGGEDGIELARVERPDLIVLDLMMPEISGFEVLTILKQDKKTQDIPIFVLTAKILSNEESDRLQNLVEAIAYKGNTNQKLLTTEISKILERYQKI